MAARTIKAAELTISQPSAGVSFRTALSFSSKIVVLAFDHGICSPLMFVPLSDLLLASCLAPRPGRQMEYRERSRTQIPHIAITRQDRQIRQTRTIPQAGAA